MLLACGPDSGTDPLPVAVPQPVPAQSVVEPGPLVLLVSLDTTRADALSCYGALPGLGPTDPPMTPNIDAIAAEGARFEHFYANAPTTLSSHATMLTGLDPHGHAIVRNGFPLDPKHPTLQERLEAAGYDTIAVLGSAALESAIASHSPDIVCLQEWSVATAPSLWRVGGVDFILPVIS